MAIDRAQRLFLLLMSFSLLPVARSYGVLPEQNQLYGISDPDLPTRRVFRALMGLFIGMICFWLAGTLCPALRIAALWTVFAFVTGIAFGRLLSLGLDGWPQPVLPIYVIAEIGLAATSRFLIRTMPNRANAGSA